jgi:uncharacterized protein (TIGR02246 family)
MAGRNLRDEHSPTARAIRGRRKEDTMIGTNVVLAGLVSAALLAPFRGGMVGVSGTTAPDPAIRLVADAYTAAMLAGDAAAAAAVYRDDAVEMPPGVPPIAGRVAIEQYFRGMFGSCRFTAFTLSHTEARASGDVAFLAGTSRATISVAAPNGGPTITEAGKYLVVLKRTGGGWKVAYSIHNSDVPGGH